MEESYSLDVLLILCLYVVVGCYSNMTEIEIEFFLID